MNQLKIIILFFIVFGGLNCYGQKKMDLFFKDGSIETGYVTFKKGKAKFQENKKEKKRNIKYEILDSASSTLSKRAKESKRKPKTVYFLPVGAKKKTYMVYELLEEGKISLYKLSNYSGYGAVWMSTGGSFGGIPMVAGKKNSIRYAVRKKGDDFITGLGGKDTSVMFVKLVDSYKRDLTILFEDCPVLVEKIENEEKGFKGKKELPTMVDYYNNQCN